MDKIIFLDIDGVLNVNTQGRDEFGAKFHKHFEDNLKWIIEETGAKIVISSTWRMSGLSEMQRMWNVRGLAGDVVGITPRYWNECRGMEIGRYIESNPCLNYVIIDDDSDMLEVQKDNFVMTSGNEDHEDCIDIGYGLTRKCSEMVINILNN